MRRQFLSFLLLLSPLLVFAQQLVVTSFDADPSEILAVSHPRKDANKQICPLVVVRITVPDVTFEGDIVGEVEQHNGDYWVYMCNEAKWLEIKAKGFIPPKFNIRDKFPQGLASKTTYKLVVQKPATGNEPTGTLVVNTNVGEADLYLDGTKQATGAPPFKVKTTDGKHTLTLKARGYNDETAQVDARVGQTMTYRVNMKAEGSFSLDGIGYEMVRIEQGSFMMGARRLPNALSTASLDMPQHQVTLRGYAIGKTEVPQALWQAVMGSNPSIHKGATLPVENVSWDDCQEFIRRLNERCNTRFRLPTEAEWEFAANCRDSNLSDTYSGEPSPDNVANMSGQTIDCGSRKASRIGLQDMNGNVAEWCQDYLDRYPADNVANPLGPETGYVRIVRGGSYQDRGLMLRNNHRHYMSPDETAPTVGLRLAQDL
ncbi:MAG: SUMF1/EgtB/PvdO family nonheme iron enzyme [Bacteroidaceae bacterium]|nr:SUMF1/EgtB/PvdO family nonheme iron enzyme [Bacteroidaceae bacterium]